MIFLAVYAHFHAVRLKFSRAWGEPYVVRVKLEYPRQNRGFVCPSSTSSSMFFGVRPKLVRNRQASGMVHGDIHAYARIMSLSTTYSTQIS